jgi:hypothetical protein
MERVDFTIVSAHVLANHGITLGEPKASPPMSKGEAAAIARQADGGGTVLESHYARCRVVSKNPPVDQDCWAFSLDPTRHRLPLGGTPVDYTLVLVDPVNGEVLLREIGVSPADPSLLRRDPRLGPA